MDVVSQVLDAYQIPERDRHAVTAPDPAREARRLREARFRARLPGRLKAITQELSSGLPDGLHFEWTAE